MKNNKGKSTDRTFTRADHHRRLRVRILERRR